MAKGKAGSWTRVLLLSPHAASGPPERAGVCEPHEMHELAMHSARGPSRAQHPPHQASPDTLTALFLGGPPQEDGRQGHTERP